MVSRRRVWLGRLTLVAAGLLLIMTAGAFTPALALFEHLRIPLFVAGVPVLTAAAWLRLKRTSLAALVVLLLNGSAVAPHLPWDEAAPASADVTLIHSNTWFRNSDPGRVGALLVREQPDVAVLLEIHDPRSDAWLAELKRLFPFQLSCGQSACGIVLLSRWPMERIASAGANDSDGIIRPGFVAARVERPSGAFTLVGAHLTRPFFPTRHETEAFWLAEQVRALPAPVVLTGDFNAAPWSRLFQGFERQSNLSRTARTLPTWPLWLGPAGIPIDHVLGSEGVSGAGRAMGSVGSDHRPVIARIDLPD